MALAASGLRWGSATGLRPSLRALPVAAIQRAAIGLALIGGSAMAPTSALAHPRSGSAFAGFPSRSDMLEHATMAWHRVPGLVAPGSAGSGGGQGGNVGTGSAGAPPKTGVSSPDLSQSDGNAGSTGSPPQLAVGNGDGSGGGSANNPAPGPEASLGGGAIPTAEVPDALRIDRMRGGISLVAGRLAPNLEIYGRAGLALRELRSLADVAIHTNWANYYYGPDQGAISGLAGGAGIALYARGHHAGVRAEISRYPDANVATIGLFRNF